MRFFAACFLIVTLCSTKLFAQPLPEKDWLLNPAGFEAVIEESPNKATLTLSNGLIRRTFRLQPNLVCYDYTNLSTNQQLIRTIREEARISINGSSYKIGGLTPPAEKAYFLPEWLNTGNTTDSSFRYLNYTIAEIQPAIQWKKKFWSAGALPAKGKRIIFRYTSPLADLKGLELDILYDIYNGIPLISKSVQVRNQSGKNLIIDTIVNEVLGMVEEESAVIGSPSQMKKPTGLYFESNYAFNNSMRYELSDQTLHWKTDPAYTSQVNYNYETPCLLEIYPDHGPGSEIKPGESLQSITTYELAMDNSDRERRGLAVRKMYRTIAPWITSNPIFMHLVSKNDDEVKTAIEQCAATGYEALILSFGSHCNMEDTSAANIKKWKELADFAHSKKIFIGSYSLFSSRRINDEEDVINPKTGKPGGTMFGNAPCLASNWGINYLRTLRTFMEKTGFDIFENDGPYPGDRCASTKHPGHKDLHDSQWKQMELQKGLYRWCNENGIYVNAPDWYFLDGTHKIAIGYREVNFSLSREQQKILNRQNIYDGTWEKTSSMGWGFVPLTKYQGGGPEAILEPLSEHLTDYEQLMMQYYGSGVQACYRGPRLYDTEATRQTVVKVINWYKKYRQILNADIIHLRRADGRDWDGILHIDPTQPTKGLAMLYNPTETAIIRTIRLPLYYTGLSLNARITEQENRSQTVSINRDFTATITVTIPANGYTWLTVTAP
ncbi:alpha-galactosidase [Flavihumibacter sp. UBA7668]|uniref:alpha-galactosidase n=1 Tax=Flavihumibacter sp. UBA7668 TaxID=1946542 RepID=UPI0025BA602B|nr:alpha-galactosidase [Flavihumibacter sp. UBA7668]